MLKHKQPSDDEKAAAFNHAVKKTLDDSQEQLDSATQLRLQAIRKEAIKQGLGREGMPHTNVGGNWPSWVLPASGFASIALVAVLTIGLWQQTGTEQNLLANLEDMSLLIASDDLELYEELEFYQWLADEQNAG